MDTRTCPKCGTKNPAEFAYCKECGDNLQWALWTKQRGDSQQVLEKTPIDGEKGFIRWWIKYIVLTAVFVIWFILLPANDPGDLGMIVLVPALWVGGNILLVFIDIVVAIIVNREKIRDFYLQYRTHPITIQTEKTGTKAWTLPNLVWLNN